MARRIRTKKNPDIGDYKVKFKETSGKFTKLFSRAKFFRLVLKNKRYGKWLEFPKSITAKQKKALVYSFIVEFYSAQEKKKARARLRYKAKRESEGKKYHPRKRERKKAYEVIGVSEKDFRKIKKQEPTIVKEVEDVYEEPEEFKFVVGGEEFEKRIRNLKSQLVKEAKRQKISPTAAIAPVGWAFLPSSEGVSTPSKKGKFENWSTFHKDKLDFDLEKESIIHNITRYVRHIGGREWFLKTAEEFRAKRFEYIRFGIALVTNIAGDSVKFAQQELGLVPQIYLDADFAEVFSENKWPEFEWSFVQNFFNTLYEVISPNQKNGLTSSGIYFQTELNGYKSKAKHKNKNFECAMQLYVTSAIKKEVRRRRKI